MSGGEHILVLEDDEGLLQLTRRTLAAPAGLIRYLESADRHRKHTKRRS